jgi:hypothetical protein
MKDKVVKNGFRPGNVVVGGVMIVLGILFLIGELFNIHIGEFIWPFFIMGPGVFLFLLSLMFDDDTGKGLSAVGGLVTMVGLVLFVQNVTGHWASWAYAWALVAPTSLGLGMFAYGLLKGNAEVRKEGWDVAKVGLGIFVVAAIFFELIVGLGGFGLGRFGWPLLLIALGVFFLFRNLTAGWHKTPAGKEEEVHVLDNP